MIAQIKDNVLTLTAPVAANPPYSKGDKLTARLINLVKKHLPEDQFRCWMSKDNRFGWYNISISPANLADFYVDPDKELEVSK